MQTVEAMAVGVRRKRRRRAAGGWVLSGVLSVGLHHLAIQGLDISGLAPSVGGARPAVTLDLFDAPRPAPAVAPATKVAVAEPDKPAASQPADASKPPETKQPERRAGARGPRRGGRAGARRLPEARPGEDALVLEGDHREQYDPLNPRLRMGDWGAERFAAAERFFDATAREGARGLMPESLRSPFEQFERFDLWGGDALPAFADFFDAASDAIRLAINPESPDALRYAPVDAVVLAYLNLRAIDGGPHEAGVAALLRALPEYGTIVGHIEISLLDSADEIYVTSSDPADRSKTVVLLRHRMPEDEIRALVGRQIAMAGGAPSWSMISDRPAVTVDAEHAGATPWLYLFPEPGLVMAVHRANLGPVLAALGGQAGRGAQPTLVYQIRRLTRPSLDADDSDEPAAAPTLFALADSGTLGAHLRVFARALSGVEAGAFSGGYLRVTGGPSPEVLGGLRLAAPDDAPQWATVMERIELQELAKVFDFEWAGRSDRLFFRLGLTDPMLESGLGVFRLWTDRIRAAGASTELPNAPALHGDVIGSAVLAPSAPSADAGAKPPQVETSAKEDAGAGEEQEWSVVSPDEASVLTTGH